MTDHVGKQFGNYCLTRLLGEGTYGKVYLGEHVELHTQAAIKILKTDYTSLTDKDRETFLGEARTLANLQHPHIVDVWDYSFKDDIPFFVMEYASNGTLRQKYPRGTVAPLGYFLSYIEQIASALQHIHNQGLIHRDVKPGNMLVTSRNTVLLSDLVSRYSLIGQIHY